MNRFVQKLNKIPVWLLVLLYFVFSFILPFMTMTQTIDKNSPVVIVSLIISFLCFILLVFRFMNYLKTKSSGLYDVFRFFFGYMLICMPAGLFIALDSQLGLNGFLMIPGLALESVLLIYLYVRYLMKRWKKEHSVREETSSSYSFENLCDDFLA